MYLVNLDVQTLTWAGAEHSVRNVWMEGAGFAWRDLGTMGKNNLNKKGEILFVSLLHTEYLSYDGTAFWWNIL